MGKDFKARVHVGPECYTGVGEFRVKVVPVKGFFAKMRYPESRKWNVTLVIPSEVPQHKHWTSIFWGKKVIHCYMKPIGSVNGLTMLTNAGEPLFKDYPA